MLSICAESTLDVGDMTVGEITSQLEPEWPVKQ